MGKTTTIPVQCACKKKKSFKQPVEKVEKKKGDKTVSVQVNCPFRHDDACVKYLTIELPAGMQLKKDEKTYRGY